MRYFILSLFTVFSVSIYADCFDIHAPVRSPGYSPYFHIDCNKFTDRTEVMDSIITSKSYSVNCIREYPGTDRARARAERANEKSVSSAKKTLMDKTQLSEVELEKKLIELSAQNKICNSKGFFTPRKIADIINENL